MPSTYNSAVRHSCQLRSTHLPPVNWYNSAGASFGNRTCQTPPNVKPVYRYACSTVWPSVVSTFGVASRNMDTQKLGSASSLPTDVSAHSSPAVASYCCR